MRTKKRFIFLLSHPIQYFSPLFQSIVKDNELDLMVLYCSDENVKGHIDKGFGVEVKWDIPLLEGYDYKFLKNNSWKPSIFNGFFGLINLEILRVLKNERGSILIVHGWNYCTNLIAIIYGKLSGIKLCLRGDNPYNQEILKSKKLLFLKKILLGKLLFQFIDHFLYVGKQNKSFYKFYGVPDHKLIFTPHAVDNERFSEEYEKYKDKKKELRNEFGLPFNNKIILTTGKYIPKKRPIDLLKAFNLLNDENITLVFLGDGELRKKMDEYITMHNLKYVYLTGFKNQSEVGKYYAVADIFVLPSGAGETWGLSVNEAMNFSLPIIVSDLVGCADDLIINGVNGFKYQLGNINALSEGLNAVISNKEKRLSFGKKSKEIVENYSFDAIINNLIRLIN